MGFVCYLHFSDYYLKSWILDRVNDLEAVLGLAYVKDLGGMKHWYWNTVHEGYELKDTSTHRASEDACIK